MGEHGRFQSFLPEKPSKNDSADAVQNNRPANDERTQLRHRGGDGQMTQAEDDGGEKNGEYYSCSSRLLLSEQFHADPDEECHQEQSH